MGENDDSNFMENFTSTLASVADNSIDLPSTSKAAPQRPRKRVRLEEVGKKFPIMPEMVTPLHPIPEPTQQTFEALPNNPEESNPPPTSVSEDRQNFLNRKLLMLQKEERALQTFLMHLRNQQSTLTVEKMRLTAEIEQHNAKNPQEASKIKALMEERDILKGFRSVGVDSGEDSDEDDDELTDEELSDEDEEDEESLEDPNQEQDLDSDMDDEPLLQNNIKLEFL